MSKHGLVISLPKRTMTCVVNIVKLLELMIVIGSSSLMRMNYYEFLEMIFIPFWNLRDNNILIPFMPHGWIVLLLKDIFPILVPRHLLRNNSLFIVKTFHIKLVIMPPTTRLWPFVDIIMKNVPDTAY